MALQKNKRRRATRPLDDMPNLFDSIDIDFSRDDIAGENGLTVCLLNAKSLGLGITAVLGRTNTLLVSEKLNSQSHHSSIFLSDILTFFGNCFCNSPTWL